tara:strand:+ start:1218 stop:2420 length:1203 start_codon:yes stop_codon:yes gene_type:complete
MNPILKGLFFSKPAAGIYGASEMAQNKYQNWMNNYNLANRNNLGLENYITLDGTTPVIDEGQLLADTNPTVTGTEYPGANTSIKETETLYPASNDLDATYTAEDAFYTPQQNKFSFPSILGLAKKVIEPNTREENFGLASFTRNPTTGRVAGNPTYDVFAGGNVASAFGKGMGNRAQKRIDTIENTLKTKYGLSDEEVEDVYAGSYRGNVNTQLIARLQNFNNQLNNYNKALGNWQGSGIDTRTGGDNRGYVGAQFGTTGYADPMVDAEENQPYNNQGYGSAQFDGSTQHGSSGMTKDQHAAFRAATGGRVGLRMGGDPTQWMSEQETITPFQLQQEEGVPIGLQASDDVNTRILENLFEKYLDLGFSPGEAEKLAMEEFESMAQGPQEEVVEEGIARLV